MIRRWGLFVFFLLALVLSAGAWVGSYWWGVVAAYDSVRTGAQKVSVDCGRMYVGVGNSWSTEGWSYAIIKVDPWWTDVTEKFYRAAPYRFLGFAFNHRDTPHGGISWRMLIIPLWFPSGLSALGLLWAWRRKRRRDITGRGGFELQKVEAVA